MTTSELSVTRYVVRERGKSSWGEATTFAGASTLLSEALDRGLDRAQVFAHVADGSVLTVHGSIEPSDWPPAEIPGYAIARISGDEAVRVIVESSEVAS